MKNVILSGGSGTRLWPLSRRLMPKQFLKLFDERSLFQHTFLRNAPFCDRFTVIANKEHYFIALEQLEELAAPKIARSTRFLLEEKAKNTAAAIAFAALASQEDEILFVTPSDHLIKDQARYQEAVQKARTYAEEGYLVTFGITPTEPHTGYGYIHAQDDRVLGFYEKPDKETAKRYFEAKEYFWNSGMFMFRADSFLQQLQLHAPQLYEAIEEVYHKAVRMGGGNLLFRHMDGIEDISVDYALMEKSDRIKMVPAHFSWNDVGSFDALAQELASDAPSIEIASHGNYIHASKMVATIGIEDTIIVDTPDALLVTKKGHTQQVKELVARLKKVAPRLIDSHTTVWRPWGSYETLIETPGYKIKRIIVKPGHRLSLQKHYHRSEHWIVVSGTAQVQVGKRTYLLRPNESTYIRMGEVHRLGNPGKIPVVLIEVQVGEYTDEDDIVRIEDDYKRL